MSRRLLTYRFFDSTELLELLAQGAFLCVPRKATDSRGLAGEQGAGNRRAVLVGAQPKTARGRSKQDAAPNESPDPGAGS